MNDCFHSQVIQTRKTACFRMWIKVDLGYLVIFLQRCLPRELSTSEIHNVIKHRTLV